ncbi:MAG: hypothetical protein FWB96_10805 [Defluviitaleaceae bacterium]|nr:hypothetical protein [Defluviitaleaceae bacterium]MCL2263365.1 hypothetical protein [Defluviitaleaceae bacterium]
MNEKVVQAWLELNDPKTNDLVQSKWDQTNAGILFAADKPSPAVGVGVITGKSGDAIKKDDAEMQAAIDSGELEKLVKVFQEKPLIGCTSVLSMARKASKYDPNGDINNSKNSERFKDYIKRVVDAPFFHLTMSEYSTYHRKEKNWDAAIDEIANLYDGVSADDKNKIRDSIKLLAKTAASNTNTKSSNNLFAVSTINSPTKSDVINIFLYSSFIQMEESESKGSHSMQSDVTINRIALDFHISAWKPLAAKVAAKHIRLVDDWLEDNKTEESDQFTKLNLTFAK